jgi:hypothetical protein
LASWAATRLARPLILPWSLTSTDHGGRPNQQFRALILDKRIVIIDKVASQP